MKFVKNDDRNDVIEFIAFNYDGKGGSLIKIGNNDHLDYLSLEETNDIILGAQGEDRQYRLVEE